MGHANYTFGFRRRLKPIEDGKGGFELRVPADIVALAGVESGETECMVSLEGDGGIVIRAMR